MNDIKLIPENYITFNDYAQAFQISRRAVYDRVKRGIIPARAIKTFQGKKYIDKLELN